MAADALRGLDDYLRAGDTLFKTLARIGLTYLARAPIFLTPLVPMTILVSGAFNIAYMARNNEIIAMKASGISLHRILTPVFIGATLMSLLGFLNQELLVPFMELRYQPVIKEWTGEDDKYESVGRFIHAENTMYMGSYNIVNQTLLEPNILFYDEGEVLRVQAKWGRFEGDGWTLHEDLIIGGKDTDNKEYFWKTSLTPDRLAIEVLPRQSRPLPVIIEHIISERERGVEASPGYAVMLYSRLSYPLVGVVLLLAGVPFMLSSEELRRSRLFGVGLCILVGGIYYTLSFLCNALGDDGTLQPWIAGFLPVALIGAVGIFLSDRIRS